MPGVPRTTADAEPQRTPGDAEVPALPFTVPRQATGPAAVSPPLPPPAALNADQIPRPPCWELVLTHRTRLLRLASVCGAGPQDAHDIVQEAMIRVATQHRVDPERVAGLLTTVVSRLVIDGHRDSIRRRGLAQQRALGALPRAGPEDDACDRAEACWLSEQTVRINGRQRYVLLRRLDGHLPVDIAHDLGCTPKAVELLHRRARLALKLLLTATLTCLAFLCTTAPPHQVAGRLPHAPSTTAQASFRPIQRGASVKRGVTRALRLNRLRHAVTVT